MNLDLSMAEITVENEVCGSCGADVRDGADFCYNCGKAVSAEALRQSFAKAEKAGEREPLHQNGTENRPLAVEISSKDSAPEPKAKLRTAADLRRRSKSKSYRSEPVQVEWVEPTHSSPIFVTAALILTALALLLLIAALYLR